MGSANTALSHMYMQNDLIKTCTETQVHTCTPSATGGTMAVATFESAHVTVKSRERMPVKTELLVPG